MAYQNFGLLGTAAEGVRAGLIAMQTQQQNNRDNQMLKMSMLNQGVQDDGSGNLSLSPDKQAEISSDRQAKSLQNQNTIQSYDPSSDHSQSIRESARGLLNQTKPGLGDSTITDDMSANDVQQLMPLYKTTDTGAYGLLSKQMMMGSNGMIGSREKQAAQRTMNNDTILKTYTQRADGASKILNLMDAAQNGDVKSNQAMLGQLNAEIGRLETGSQNPGLGQSEKTEMQDAAAKYHNILDTITGDVTGVDLSQKFNQARAMVKDLGGSYVGAINDRADFLSSGATDNQQDTFDAKKQSIQEKYGNRFKNSTGGQGLLNGGEQTSSGGGLLGGAQQSQQYTPDVVSYAKKHGISADQALAIKNQRTGAQ